MSELLKLRERERELFAVLEAATGKRNQAGVELAGVIFAYGPERSRTEDEARDKVLEAVRQEDAALNAWSEVYDTRRALEASVEEVAA